MKKGDVVTYVRPAFSYGGESGEIREEMIVCKYVKKRDLFVMVKGKSNNDKTCKGTPVRRKCIEHIKKAVMNHSELVEIGYKWCLSKCSFAFKELVTINREIPDVLGFNHNGTFLLEAKISRTDFLRDKKKFFRQYPEQGMGDWRFYIAPKGIIKIHELPELWGLIEVNEKGKPRIVFNPFGKGNIYSNWKRNLKSDYYERAVLVSALRRVHLQGNLDNIYNKSNDL